MSELQTVNFSRSGTFRELLKRPGGVFGLTLVVLLVILAWVSLLWLPHNPNFTYTDKLWQPPSAEFWLGTDGTGRDIFSRLMAGSQVAIQVAVFSALVALIIGLALGILSSLTQRWFREGISVFIDVLVAFPTLLIAMMLAAAFGGSITVVIVSVGISYGVSLARVTKAEITRVYSSDFVLAAKASGVNLFGIIRRHLLPNIAPVLYVQLSLSMGLAILAEAGLSYLGYGAPLLTPSWGRMLADLQRYIELYPEVVLAPGITIALTVLAFNLLGDALREATDPRLRSSGVVERASEVKK